MLELSHMKHRAFLFSVGTTVGLANGVHYNNGPSAGAYNIDVTKYVYKWLILYLIFILNSFVQVFNCICLETDRFCLGVTQK